jgi:hypothetical protein
MDLIDVALEEGFNEQDKNGEEAQSLSQAQATAIEFSNEGKAPEQQEVVPEIYKYPGSGMSVPTEGRSGSLRESQNYSSLERLRKLLPIIPGK